jgi:hypothetical protein
MKWDSKEFRAWLAEMEPKIGDDLRLLMAALLHIDARISGLQTTCIYIATVLTLILGALLLK